MLPDESLRLQNLRTLEWDTHFAQRHTNDGKTLFLVLPAHEVKNDSDIELPLPKWLEPVFDRYINDYRSPLIADTLRTQLFSWPLDQTAKTPYLIEIRGFFWLRGH